VGRSPFTDVDEVLEALGALEDGPGDDVVPALDHLLQTAHLLAIVAPDDDELLVAGLLHDVASALDPTCPDHPGEGARLVRPLFGTRVAALVAGHAEAKRYLVAVEPPYAAGLSAVSTATLVDQGGPMREPEVRAFARGPHAAALVALRRADDAAKVPGRVTRPVGSWRPALARVARVARVAR
jgi:predicted HD phosphohydrolase